jgi:ribosome-binding ATPase YchF (GTP1/OBG family)
VKAETISYEDFIKYGSEEAAKRNNAMRSEGKEYVMQDGDVVHFLTSA